MAARRFNATAAPMAPAGPRPARLTLDRVAVYVVLFGSALIFSIPLYVMIITSLKTMPEIRASTLLSLPQAPTLAAWVQAWMHACTGLTCNGIQVGFWNSVQILIPSVIVSITLGSLSGYALNFWKVPGSGFILGGLLVGAFIPYPVFVFPLVRLFSWAGLYGSLAGIVAIHSIFGLPVMTLLFRNYYASLPIELFKAARIDGAGFWRIFISVMAPMSVPMTVVAVILQVTGIWNDFLLGLVFAGRDNLPMTVQLNNIVNSTTGERMYNVEMAATLLTALVPLAVYFFSGKWFVRGIASGAVKG